MQTGEAVSAALVPADDSLARRAANLQRAGYSVAEIAEELGEDENTVVRVINSRIKTERSLLTSESRTAVIDLHMERYEALIKAHWLAASMGDPKSTELVLKTLKDEQNLLQLGAVDTTAQGAKVLIVAGQEKAYVDKLREIVEG